MNAECKSIITGTLAAAGPLVILAFGSLLARLLNRHGILAARLGAQVGAVAFGCSLLTLCSLAFSDKVVLKTRRCRALLP